MTVHHPHDHFFRESFRKREIIENFLQEYLPPVLLNEIDLDTLQLEEGSYIDEELRIHQTDMLYRVQTIRNQRLWLYLLFDHKSAPDRWVILQLLRYMVRIWEENKPTRKTDYLPPILPLVLYHGEQNWQLATDMHALFGTLPAPLQPYTPQFNYQLHNFSYRSDVEIKGKIWLQVCLMTLRSIFDPRLRQQLPQLVDLVFRLSEQETGLEYIYTILYYLSVATERVDKETMTQLLLAQGEQGARQMATLAQQWIEEGIEQGIEQKAREERGRLRLILIRLRRRHSLVTASEIIGLSIEETVELQSEIDEVSQLLEKHTVEKAGELAELPVEEVIQLRDEFAKDG